MDDPEVIRAALLASGLPADELITPIRSALSGASTTVEVKGHVAPGQGDALPDPRARRSGRTTAR